MFPVSPGRQGGGVQQTVVDGARQGRSSVFQRLGRGGRGGAGGFKGRLALRGVLVGQQQADRIRKEERKEQNLKSRFIHFVDLRRFRKTLGISKTSSTDLYFKTVIFINGLKQLDIL